MAVKSFISPTIKWVPQSGFSVEYTENGGIEARQDVLVRNSDLAPGSVLAAFVRGTAWQVIWPEVPIIYRNLPLKTFDPQDRGDGWSMVKCSFAGYALAGNGSSGEEQSVPTSTLSGQLNPEALSSHPKWEALDSSFKYALGELISGNAQAKWDFTQIGTYHDGDGIKPASFIPIENEAGAITLTGDAIIFAKIIAEGDSTWDKGGWTYSYHTASKTGFTQAQLSSLGKIVNPPGNPVDPGTGWKWQLAGPNQTQSGSDSFTKTLDFRLIQDNAKNQFLYG